MHLPVFTLEEDVNALPALLPTPRDGGEIRRLSEDDPGVYHAF